MRRELLASKKKETGLSLDPRTKLALLVTIILFDEPTSGLDLFHMRQVADSVKGLADSGKTIVIVTHDPEFILRCCNYVIHLENGRLEESYFLQDTEGRERLFNFFMMEGGGGNQTV